MGLLHRPAPRRRPRPSVDVVADMTAPPAYHVLTIPGLRLVSEANARGKHWGAKASRTAKTRDQVGWNLVARAGRTPPPLPVTVTITRVGVRRLDGDNLQAACKATRDAVAAWLGVDDACPLVTWKYEQLTARGYAVKIEIERVVP